MKHTNRAPSITPRRTFGATPYQPSQTMSTRDLLDKYEKVHKNDLRSNLRMTRPLPQDTFQSKPRQSRLSRQQRSSFDVGLDCDSSQPPTQTSRQYSGNKSGNLNRQRLRKYSNQTLSKRVKEASEQPQNKTSIVSSPVKDRNQRNLYSDYVPNRTYEKNTEAQASPQKPNHPSRQNRKADSGRERSQSSGQNLRKPLPITRDNAVRTDVRKKENYNPGIETTRGQQNIPHYQRERRDREFRRTFTQEQGEVSCHLSNQYPQQQWEQSSEQYLNQSLYQYSDYQEYSEDERYYSEGYAEDYLEQGNEHYPERESYPEPIESYPSQTLGSGSNQYPEWATEQDLNWRPEQYQNWDSGQHPENNSVQYSENQPEQFQEVYEKLEKQSSTSQKKKGVLKGVLSLSRNSKRSQEISKKYAGAALSLVLFLGVFGFFQYPGSILEVSGASMEPKFHSGDKIFASRVFGKINRFDIVVVSNENTENLSNDSGWIKRVIGLPGETIKYKNGELFVDGKKVDQSFAEKGDSWFIGTEDFGPITLGDDEYWVMGDNRSNSCDSRYVGAFKREDIKYVYHFTFSKQEILTSKE